MASGMTDLVSQLQQHCVRDELRVLLPAVRSIDIELDHVTIWVVKIDHDVSKKMHFHHLCSPFCHIERVSVSALLA